MLKVKLRKYNDSHTTKYDFALDFKTSTWKVLLVMYL